ncbi:helix-turn-helix domain-containing protein [Schleiferilactobacillus shenzhenensis]|nr:helix-turn-helix transcriptional regulator [Schleiferilactobacillus shenzhenensis]
MNNEALRKRLIQLRESHDLSQSEVARRIGMDNSSLSRIESGDRKVSAEEVSKFASLYGVTTDYLLGNLNTPEWASPKDVVDLKQYLDDPEAQDAFNFEGKPLTDTEKEKLQIAITQIFWDRLKQIKKK